MVIQREGRWSSSAFMVYVRDNIDDLQWMSEVFSSEKGRGSQDKEPGGDRRGNEETRSLVGECLFQSSTAVVGRD